MSLLRALADSPIIERMGWLLVHSLWQALAVAALLAAVLPVVRRRGARTAYACCCGALLLTALLPALTFPLIPQTAKTTRAFEHVTATAAPIPEIAVQESPIGFHAAMASPARFTFRSQRGMLHHPLPSTAAPLPSAAAPLTPSPSVIATGPPAAAPVVSLSLTERAASLERQFQEKLAWSLPWIVLAWSVGVAAVSIWNIGGWFAVQRLKSNGTSPVTSAVEEAARRIARQLGMSRPVRLLRSTLVASPLVIGALKPVILLPASLMTELPPEQLEALLAHELAHVLRQDYLVNLLQSVVETLLFYHPAVWWISSQIRKERENCCDDLAVNVTRDRTIYVRALASVAGARVSGMVPAATGGVLVARLRRILGLVDRHGARTSSWLTGAAILTFAILAVVIVALQSRPATAQTKSEQSPSKAAAEKKQGSAKPAQALASAPQQRRQTTDRPQFPTKGQIRIRVVDPAGQPAAHVQVHVSIWTDEDFEHNHGYATDKQGLVIARLPKKLWILRLWARKRGYCEEFQNFEPNARIHELIIPDEFTFHLVKGATVAGTVKNEEGQPVKEARVQYFSGYVPHSVTRSDYDGRYRFDDVRPGISIQIQATHPDYRGNESRRDARSEQKVVAQTTRTEVPPIVLRRGIRATVKVTDPLGKPVEHALVISGEDQYPRLTRNMLTDENGVCQVPALAPGATRLTVLAKGWMPMTRKVVLQPKMQPIDFQLRPGKKLRIRFVDGRGAPVPNVHVFVDSWRGVRNQFAKEHAQVDLGIPDRADKKGVFEWNWAPDDAVSYLFLKEGSARTEQSITADGREHLQTINHILRITGNVRDAFTGREIENFLVVPILFFRPDWPSLVRRLAQKQSHGVFGMQFDRTDAEHGIQIEALGYKASRTAHRYRVGDPDPVLDIRLQRETRYVGKVLSPEGRPVKGARVSVASRSQQLDDGLSDQDQQLDSNDSVRTDADGAFEIASQLERYALDIVAPDGFAEIERQVNQPPGEIRIQRWASLSGRLVQSGKPIADWEVFLTPIRAGGGENPHNFSRLEAKTAADGSFAFPRVPPIPCRVNAWLHFGAPSPLTSSESMPLRLAPGETGHIVLGGNGIDVTGQLVAENQTKDFDYHFAINYLVAKRPGIQPPTFLLGKGFDWHKGWSDAWTNSPEGGAYLDTLHHWFVKPEPNGRVRISGVEPGDYNFAVNLYGKTEGCLVHPIATRVVHITIKPGASQLELGKISIPSLPVPKVGDVAPDFDFTDGGGSKSSLSALRGKYVLIDFWATWCGPCVQHLDDVEGLRKQFAGNNRLVVVGANLDPDPANARAFLNGKPLPWKHAMLGDWSATDVPRRFAISTIPAYVLIGHDGRILASEYSLEELTPKLQPLKHPEFKAPKRREQVSSKAVAEKTPEVKASAKPATTTRKARRTTDLPRFPTKGKMRIQVVDMAGKPLEKAKIHVSIWTQEKFRRGRDYRTDSQGRVTVELPKTLQILRLWASKDAYCGQFVNFQTNTAVHELVIPDDYTFRLLKGTIIGGVVKDEDGRPIQRAKVAYNDGGVFFGDDTVTDANGRWRFDNVEPGSEVLIRVTHPDYISDHGAEMQKAQKVTTEMLRAQTATIVMRRGFRITGKVTDPAGEPVKRAILLSGDDPYFGSVTAPVLTDENGQFRFPVMAAGTIRLTVVADGWMPETRQIQIGASKLSTDFHLKPGKKLRIRFVDRDGTSISGVRVQVEQWKSVRHLLTEPNWHVRLEIPERANHDGVFEWDWAPEDPVQYNFSKEGYASMREVTVTADGREHVQVLNSLLEISGTVRDAVSGRPIDGFLAIPVIHFRSNFAALERSHARQENAGRFKLQFDRTDVEHGVQIEAPGYRTFRTSKRYRSGDADAEIDIRLERGPRYIGSVIDDRGQPVKDARLYIASASEQFSLDRLKNPGAGEIDRNARIQLDANGRFEIPAQLEKYAVIAITHEGYGEVLREAGELPGQIHIRRWAKVSGQLLQSGKPVPNCMVMLSPIRLGGDAPHVFINLQTTTGDDGSFVFERVPPGPSRVEGWLHFSAASPLTSSRSMPLHLAPGESTHVVLGSGGIDVTGRLVAENQPSNVDYHFSLNYLVARRPGIELPAFLAGKGFDWQKGWSDALTNSPEGRAYLDTLHHWFVKPEPDGRVRISGVEPGDYDFAVNLYGKTEGCLVHPIATRVVHISVKPGASQLDLGKISIPSLAVPKVGDVAPDFEFMDLSGHKSSLAALRGKYVLIDFWATWCGPCVQQLDGVEGLRKQFAHDNRLVVVGANLDPDPASARTFLKSKPLPWQHAFLGDWSATDVPRRFAVSTIPAYVLIGPDGRILASEYSLEELTPKLQQLKEAHLSAQKRS